MSTSALPAMIAIAAPPGGGKTTLTRLLSARLGAPTLCYDDYEQMTRRSPAEIEAWLDRGAPGDEVPLPHFAEAMLALKQRAGRHAIIDFMLARAHQPTARLIDWLIWIDTPLDLALARTLAHQVRLAGKAAPQAAARFIGWLDGYLESYPRVMRRGYQLQLETVRPQADLVLDGTLSPEQLADLAAAEIRRRFP